MSQASLNSNSVKSAPVSDTGAFLRDLVAAMPIVILINALREAFQHTGQPRATLQMAGRR